MCYAPAPSTGISGSTSPPRSIGQNHELYHLATGIVRFLWARQIGSFHDRNQWGGAGFEPDNTDTGVPATLPIGNNRPMRILPLQQPLDAPTTPRYSDFKSWPHAAPGLASRHKGAQPRRNAVFLRAQHGKPQFWRAVRGAARLAGSFVRYANSHSSASPIGVREAGI